MKRASTVETDVQQQLHDITQHEILALQTEFNLADAHTHQRQSPTQRNIVARLPQLWHEAEETTQRALEQKFIERFYTLHRQPTALKTDKTMLFYAASIAMVAASTYCMQKRLTVSLIDPCFDNLVDILKNLHVPLRPLHEEALYDGEQIYHNLARANIGDVLCLVDPNNPTGFSLAKHGRAGFEQVIRYCKDFGKILFIDFCFASFALLDPNFGRLDIYDMLEESGVTYIAIEDTGKTWPLQDAKCALMRVSDDIHPEVYNIYTSILLNVSPFILNMLSEYLSDAIEDNMASVADLLHENREFLRQQVQGSIFEYVEPVIKTSVAWLRITDPALNATLVQQKAYEKNVYVLPGTYFFWSRRETGERFIRLAMARQPELFRGAVTNLLECVRG
jgi:aspartate/methionine/tyrosine aminotransferase